MFVKAVRSARKILKQTSIMKQEKYNNSVEHRKKASRPDYVIMLNKGDVYARNNAIHEKS